MNKELLQQALDALIGVLDDAKDLRNASISGGLYEVIECRDAIAALREAIAQPVQQQLVPLTDKQIYDLWPSECMAFCEEASEFARAIEAHRGIKPAGERGAA